MATRKYKVKVKSMKLEGCSDGDGHDKEDINLDSIYAEQGDEEEEKVVSIKMKWKGEPKFGLVPFNLSSSSKPSINFSKEKFVKRLEGGGFKAIEWNDDEEFENICSFTIVSTSQDGHQKFGPWDISFSLLYVSLKLITYNLFDLWISLCSNVVLLD